jgi:hypothetical protein
MLDRIIGAGLIAVMVMSTVAAAADCSADADEVNVKCYPSLQAAVDAALATDRPLMLPRGTYRIAAPVVIDYSRHAGTGFELISRGATIEATGTAGPALEIICSGGSPAAPQGCFYFHQEGTLFVNANTNGYAVLIGQSDFSDAHNSIKIDHLIVNNGNPGAQSGGVQFNYVLDSDLFIVADAAGGVAGLDLRQLQFSTLKGAGSAAQGYSVAIEDGYVIANVLQTIDQEASPICTLFTAPHAAGNTWTGYYQDCPTVDVLSPKALTGNTVTGGVIGGLAREILRWSD